MSYSYGQYPGENFSNPTTPSLDAFPTWETVEHEEQQSPQQQQVQQQQMNQHQSELPSPTGPPPHTPQQYQTIQLEEPTHVVHSQPQSAHDDTPIRLHHVHTRSERRRDSLRDSESRLLHVDTTRSVSESVMAMPIRQTRSHQQQVHPYRRPPSATSAVPPRQREPSVRFASVQPGSSSSMPSPAMPSPIGPSPGSVTSRLANFSSAIGSPMISSDLPRRRFIIRTDSNYDPETKVLTAMLELPGVKKSDVRVTLSTCHYNRVKQITVSGHSTPVFLPVIPEVGTGGEFTIRERKFGEFSRTFAVPSDTKREDIDASMEDGVLTVKVPCGMSVNPNPEDIPVR